MTVRELIDWLGEFAEDMEVVIGMRQRFGTDFAMSIESVDEYPVNPFWGEKENLIVITEGGQVGSVCYDEDDD